MRQLLVILALITGAIPFSTYAQDDVPSSTTETLVTLRVEGLDDVGLARIETRISKEPNANMEYSCLATGVVVLHFRSLPATEKADVIATVKRMLTQAGITGPVEFLNVHMEQGAGNKC